MTVGRVPRLQIGQRADAVDARVRPEVDQHDVTAQRGERQRSHPGRVEPVLRAREFRCRTERFKSVRGRQQRRLAGVRRRRLDARARAFARRGAVRRHELLAVAVDLVQPPGDAARALERRGQVDVRDVLRDELVEVDVEVRQDRDRRQDHDRAERALQQRSPPGAAHAVEQPPAAERQREQHERRAERVGDRDRDRPAARGADRDHRGEDRARARRVDEAERAADEQSREEAVAARARAEARQARERRLDPIGDAGHEQRDAEREQHDDRDVAQRVRAEADAVDDLRDADDRHRERDRQSEHDAERPPSAADAAGRQQRREHGQHARRQGRAGAGEDGEADQDDHLL